MTELLRITDVSRSFGAATVLSGIDFSLARGERLAVVGSSGSGKTTLLRLIAGLDVPGTGEISINGKVVSRPGKLLVMPEHRGVAMVFQGLALFPHLRALDQIAFAARGENGRQRARELLEKVGLASRASAPLDQLSGGERQRIALARALAQEPLLILMDEPFASLDDQRRAEMRELLRDLLSDTDAALILVTHSRDDALDLAERVIVLDQGRPAVSGSLAEVLANPRHSAAVRCLSLGQIIHGQTSDGQSARTSFGIIPMARPCKPGTVQLLIRPAQPKLCADGVEAEVIAVELRPPETGHSVRRFAIVRAGDQTLRVEIPDGEVVVGQHIRIKIDGPCLPVD
jgi:iron(III) transport system ATP-binding protein